MFLCPQGISFSLEHQQQWLESGQMPLSCVRPEAGLCCCSSCLGLVLHSSDPEAALENSPGERVSTVPLYSQGALLGTQEQPGEMVRTTSCVHCVRGGWRAAALKGNASLGQMPEIGGKDVAGCSVKIGSCCVKVERSNPGARQ